jgi:hypothetical protein
MRYPLLIGAVLVFATGAAWAQDRSRDYDDDHGSAWSDRGSSDRDWSEGRGDRMGGRMGYAHRYHDRRSGAASFYVRSGDTRLAVRCDERESMRSCADTALTVLDRIRTQGSTAPLTAPAAPPATSPPAQPR